MKFPMTIFLAAALAVWAQDEGVIHSHRLAQDVELTADPDAGHWKSARGVWAEGGFKGEPVPGHRTEIRSVWTPGYIHFLFTCPYQELYLKPNPDTRNETNKLWEWDVAEVFVGWDFNNINQYKEFQVSPQGEWVDLDIDRSKPNFASGWVWNSGFTVKARIDEARKVWYGEMRIPYRAIDPHPPEPGRELRINLYRIQGPPPDRKHVAWRPTHKPSYHVPEAFGRLILAR